jgi:hypothetical protein
MTYPGTSPAGEPATKRPGPHLALCIALIVVGAGLGITGLAVGVAKVVHNFTGTVYTAPATVHRQLGSGTYEVFAETDDASAFDPFGAVLRAADVQVTSASGQSIPTTDRIGTDEHLDRGSANYDGVVDFTIHTAGDYTIKVAGHRGERFFVSRTFGDLAKHAAIWFVLMGIGILVGIAGIVLLIVGIVRRRNVSRPPVTAYAGYPGMGQGMAQALPPPGWYPNPDLPGTTRWWDGAQWTDQTHPS